MKKLLPFAIAAILIVLVLGYLGRHKIKSLLMGYQPAPASNSYSSPNSNASPVANSNGVYATMSDPTKGSYMTDSKGMTLYVFDKDTKGVSNCYNGCAQVWPAYKATGNETQLPADITVISRTDGTKQFAWKGMPLYYYASDQKPGDTMGDGIQGIWHIVKL